MPEDCAGVGFKVVLHEGVSGASGLRRSLVCEEDAVRLQRSTLQTSYGAW